MIYVLFKVRVGVEVIIEVTNRPNIIRSLLIIRCSQILVQSSEYYFLHSSDDFQHSIVT